MINFIGELSPDADFKYLQIYLKKYFMYSNECMILKM